MILLEGFYESDSVKGNSIWCSSIRNDKNKSNFCNTLRNKALVVCKIFGRVLCFEFCASQTPNISVRFTSNRFLTKFT